MVEEGHGVGVIVLDGRDIWERGNGCGLYSMKDLAFTLKFD